MTGSWERAAIAAAAAALALAFALVTLPWGAPDEPQHYEYVATVARVGRLPGREDMSLETQARLLDSMAQHDYWRLGHLPRRTWGYAPTQLDRPPLPYLLYLPAYLLSPDPDPAERLALMRLVSVALTALTVLVVARLAADLFPDDPLRRLGPPLLAGLTPQVGFIGGSLNSDNLANLVGAATFLALARAVRPGATARAWLPVVALLAVGLATKRTTLFMLPLVLAAAALVAVAWWRRRPTSEASGSLASARPPRWSRAAWSRVVDRPGAGTALAAVAGGAGRATSLAPVGGSGSAASGRVARPVWLLVGLAAPLAILGGLGPGAGAARWIVDRWIANQSLILNLHLLVWPGRDWSAGTLWGTYTHMARALFESYWARFGWMNVPLAPALYALLMVACALPLLGLIRLALRGGQPPLEAWPRRVLWLALGAASLVLLPIALQYSLVFVPGSLPQGRYLFPALAPIGLLGSIGLAALVPPTRRRLAVGALAAGLVLLDVVSLVGYAWPAYHPAA